MTDANNDIVKKIVDAKLAEGGMGEQSTPPPKPPTRESWISRTADAEASYSARRARLKVVKAAPVRQEPDLGNWLNRAPPPLPTQAQMELRAMARRHVEAIKGKTFVPMTKGDLDRMASIVQRAIGDLLEAGGFIWTPAQQAQIESQVRGWMTTTAFYDGLVFRPVREIDDAATEEGKSND